MDEVYREVVRSFPTISLATVYNTLDTLESIREVQSVTIDPSRKRYDPDTRPHHHMMCDRCGMIRDVFGDFADRLSVPDELAREFQVDQTLVSFRGLCRRCASKAC